MFSAWFPQYWQRWPSRAKTERREMAMRVWRGTWMKCASRMTEGSGKRRPLGAVVAAGVVDELGLLVDHQDERPPRGHDAERLEGRVEDERSAVHLSADACPRCVALRHRSARLSRPTARRRRKRCAEMRASRRAHSRYSTTSSRDGSRLRVAVGGLHAEGDPVAVRQWEIGGHRSHQRLGTRAERRQGQPSAQGRGAAQHERRTMIAGLSGAERGPREPAPGSAVASEP